MHHVYRFYLLALLAGVLMIPVSAQNSDLNIQLLSIEDNFYPEITATFQVIDTTTGRSVGLDEDQVSATLGDEDLDLTDLMRNEVSLSPIGIMIVFDLTSSLSDNFLDEQKNTATAIIEETLNPGDQVGIVTFDTDGAEVAVPLGPDRNLALNTIDTLNIVPGPSNRFFDGVLAAMQELQNGDASLRRSTIVMTDVIDPQGDATANDSIAIAQQIQAPIYLIGFNDADESELRPFSEQTNGYTYMQRELEQENVDLTRMALTLSEVLSTEYTVTFTAEDDATNANDIFSLAIDLNGVTGNADATIMRRTREIKIEFPNISDGQIVADEVTFDPNVTYADTGEDVDIQSAAYFLEQGSGNEVLNPADSSDPNYTWNIENVIGGIYSLRLDITDNVGNTGSGSIQVEVASPISISFVSPVPDATAEEDFATVAPGETTVEVAVEGTFPVNEVTLFVDNQALTTLTQSPYLFTWDTTNLAGQYTLRVEATDVQNNGAQAQSRVNVTIPEGTGIIAIVVALVVAALFILIFVVISLRRRSIEDEPEPLAGQAEYERAPEPVGVISNSTVPKLQVTRGIADNSLQIYPLDRVTHNVGRSRSNDIRVVGEMASREHAIIYRDDSGQYLYQDKTTRSNKSIINGMPLQGKHILREGDRIVVGDTEFIFTYNA